MSTYVKTYKLADVYLRKLQQNLRADSQSVLVFNNSVYLKIFVKNASRRARAVVRHAVHKMID